MSDVTIESDGTKGRLVLDTEAGTAEMTFSVLSPQTVIVDHTAVPKALEGQGYGSTLAHALVDYARENAIKVVPLCPFLNGWRSRHPEAADIFKI